LKKSGRIIRPRTISSSTKTSIDQVEIPRKRDFFGM
jgi:hypothetical protein